MSTIETGVKSDMGEAIIIREASGVVCIGVVEPFEYEGKQIKKVTKTIWFNKSDIPKIVAKLEEVL